MPSSRPCASQYSRARRNRGDTEVVCLVSTDDEAYTYNKRVNRIAIVREHRSYPHWKLGGAIELYFLAGLRRANGVSANTFWH
jgi:hypothetical protein